MSVVNVLFFILLVMISSGLLVLDMVLRIGSNWVIELIVVLYNKIYGFLSMMVWFLVVVKKGDRKFWLMCVFFVIFNWFFSFELFFILMVLFLLICLIVCVISVFMVWFLLVEIVVICCILLMVV